MHTTVDGKRKRKRVSYDDIPMLVMGIDNGVAECSEMGSLIPHNYPIRALHFMKYALSSILLHPVHRATASKSTQNIASDPIKGPHSQYPMRCMVNYGVEYGVES